ncbi:hypothetical protein HPB52_020611 [Rhipicephalus sanguineus]|uniref:Uncharacterized protein n=1 Tax=Rhipicephalus sanguineus TaxID=34632 RepID=A0A9D4SRC0_RHISA|nr:hypothetical protein HPB52_020611 [Rhipicephalus sanguineus]
MPPEAIINLSGKVAIITGASSGIGWSTAKLFAKLGARLSLNGRKEDKLKLVAEACQQYMPKDAKILQTPGDLRDTQLAETLVESTSKKFGKIDILVNCAGIIANGSIENSSLEQYDEMFAINVSPGVVLTELQRRGGMTEESYAAVPDVADGVAQSLDFAHPTILVSWR